MPDVLASSSDLASSSEELTPTASEGYSWRSWQTRWKEEAAELRKRHTPSVSADDLEAVINALFNLSKNTADIQRDWEALTDKKIRVLNEIRDEKLRQSVLDDLSR